MIFPDKLNPGDLIEILAPAKTIEETPVQFAVSYLERKGFNVQVSTHCLGEHGYFSGNLDARVSDFQNALDNPEVKAILCARGGYGCVQFSDLLDWSAFEKQPKWIVGFSDVTFFHQKLQTMGYCSVHGSMPLNFESNSSESLTTLVASLDKTLKSISVPSHSSNVEGMATGELVGGNFCILSSLIGTNDQPDYTNTILFIEEVDEALYAIDRMLFSLKKAGILDEISGLIVGGMTSMRDSNPPYGSTLEEVVLSHVASRKIPVCFGFPAGHIDDNRALILGAKHTLSVSKTSVALTVQHD